MFELSGKLRSLGFSTYDEYLSSEWWALFRRCYKNSKKQQSCLVCNETHVELHHVSYSRLGAEKLTDVVPLCRFHHEAVHKWLKENRVGVEFTYAAIAAFSKRTPVTTNPPKKRKSLNKAGRPNPAARQREIEKLAELRAVQMVSIVEKLRSMALTERQTKRMTEWIETKNFSELRGLLRSVEHALAHPKPPPPVRSKPKSKKQKPPRPKPWRSAVFSSGKHKAGT